MGEYILVIVISLLFTILIEEVVAHFFGFKTKNERKVIALVSLVTFPILNIVLFIIFKVFTIPTDSLLNYLIVISSEIIVIYVEYRIIKYVYNFKYSSNKIFLTSMLMNTSSYLLGSFILLPWLLNVFGI